jgi:WD40 repeat protein
MTVKIAFPTVTSADANLFARELRSELVQHGIPASEISIARADPNSMDLGSIILITLEGLERLAQIKGAIDLGTLIYNFAKRNLGEVVVGSSSPDSDIETKAVNPARIDAVIDEVMELHRINSSPRHFGIVYLGASRFPNNRELDRPSFAASKRRVEEVLTKKYLLADSIEDLDLFNRDLLPSQIVHEVHSFLTENDRLTDLIIYYCGHGSFLPPDRTYYLMLRTTHPERAASTGLQFKQFRTDLDEVLSGKRIYLLLDCCYAAAAVSDWMAGSNISTVIGGQIEDVFPSHGTALLAATSRSSPAIAPADRETTLFSGHLADAIENGADIDRDVLSLSDIAQSVRNRIRREGIRNRVLPELYAPRQMLGDVSRIPLTRNGRRVLSITHPATIIMPSAPSSLDSEHEGTRHAFDQPTTDRRSVTPNLDLLELEIKTVLKEVAEADAAESAAVTEPELLRPSQLPEAATGDDGGAASEVVPASPQELFPGEEESAAPVVDDAQPVSTVLPASPTPIFSASEREHDRVEGAFDTLAPFAKSIDPAVTEAHGTEVGEKEGADNRRQPRRWGRYVALAATLALIVTSGRYWAGDRGGNVVQSPQPERPAPTSLACTGSAPALDSKVPVGGPNITVELRPDFAGSSALRTVVVSPDGARFATAGDDGVVRIWNASTFSLERSLQPRHHAEVYSASFSKDGSLIGAAGREGLVRIWNVRSGNVVYEFKATTIADPVKQYGVALFPSDSLRYVNSVGDDGYVQIWDIEKGSHESRRSSHADNSDVAKRVIRAIGFSPKGSGEYATAGFDGRIEIVRPVRQSTLIEAFSGKVLSLAYSPDGAMIAAAGVGEKSATVKLWKTGETKPAVLRGHPGYAVAVSWSTDGTHLLTGGGTHDRLVRLWRVSTLQQRATFEGHILDVEAVAFLPIKNRIVSVSEDMTIRLWDIETRKELLKAIAFGSGDEHIVYADNGCYSGSSGIERRIKVAFKEDGKVTVGEMTQPIAQALRSPEYIAARAVGR